MDEFRFRPSRWLLACWVVGVALAALAVGKSAAGVATVAGYPVDQAFALTTGASFVLGCLAVGVHFCSLRYALEGHYVTRTAGVLFRRRRSIPLDRITSVDVQQGPIDLLCHMGAVCIHTPSSGSDAPEERLIGVPQPLAVKAAILQAAEGERRATDAETLRETREMRALLAAIDLRLNHIEQHLVPPTLSDQKGPATSPPDPGAAVSLGPDLPPAQASPAATGATGHAS